MSYDHDFEPGAFGVCRRCGEEKHGPAGSSRKPTIRHLPDATDKPTMLDEITERDLAFERVYKGDL